MISEENGLDWIGVMREGEGLEVTNGVVSEVDRI